MKKKAHLFSRSELLLGEAALRRLADSRVVICGIGGVGSYVAESLVRSGVGQFLLVDSACISVTNLNRQVHALQATVGRPKTDVMRERMQAICPQVQVELDTQFLLPDTVATLDLSQADYVVDAVDTVAAKIALVLRAQALGIPIISAMGAGNKLDATRFRVGDIFETRVCPLARVLRRELKNRGVKGLKVVWSDETPLVPAQATEAVKKDECQVSGFVGGKERIAGSVAFVPPVMGMILAGEVVKDLTALVRGGENLV